MVCTLFPAEVRARKRALDECSEGFVSEGKDWNAGILNVIMIVCWEQQVNRPGEEEQSRVEVR